jgi:predicted RNA-binding Zn-ribbon protein involved in translation (DUF1610 family)
MYLGWNKIHRIEIILLTMFLGWTVLGWIGALVWALLSPNKTKSVDIQYTCNKCGYTKRFDQNLKIYKCPQCGEENIVK